MQPRPLLRRLAVLAVLLVSAVATASSSRVSDSEVILGPSSAYSDGLDTLRVGYSLDIDGRTALPHLFPSPHGVHAAGADASKPILIRHPTWDHLVLKYFERDGDDAAEARDAWHAAVTESLRRAVADRSPAGVDLDHAATQFVLHSSGRRSAPMSELYTSPNRGIVVVAVDPKWRIPLPPAAAAQSISPDVAVSDILVDALPGNTQVHRLPLPPARDTAAGSMTVDAVLDEHVRIEQARERGVARAMEVLADPKLQRKPTKPAPGDERIHALLANITTDELRADATFLTGENPDSPLTTRHSLSKGHLTAAEWIKKRFTAYGCDSVELVSFREGYGPNVVCTIEGADLADEQVVLGAHLDDRGSLFVPFSRAPGANDDGSGTSMLLASLRHLKESGIRLRRTLKVVNFCGEEQGLIGSKAYARSARARGDPIVFMLQGDMLAYRHPGEPLQCALPAAHASPEASLVVRKVAEVYTPEVVVGTTSACCSDHQSFYEQGFISTQIFERNGPIKDPMYHNRGDTVGRIGYDFEQLQALTRIALATTVTVAEIAEA
ncbi:hypothetical protein H9P43_001036 [Blastocladiella emersonii ATCC 22665]|nr:hypothetical protein H9P43_001036 [Blastocladiella emersonii ATCC 22665]